MVLLDSIHVNARMLLTGTGEGVTSYRLTLAAGAAEYQDVMVGVQTGVWLSLTGVKGMFVSGRSLLFTAISIPAWGITPRSIAADVATHPAHQRRWVSDRCRIDALLVHAANSSKCCVQNFCTLQRLAFQ